MVKICTRYTLPKTLNEYHNKKCGTNGKQARCKACRDELRIVRRHTVPGLITLIHGTLYVEEFMKLLDKNAIFK